MGLDINTMGLEATEKGWGRPLSMNHPCVGDPCLICDKPLSAGDVPALVIFGPADASDARKKSAGMSYTAGAVLAHERCVYPPEEAVSDAA